MVGVLLYDANFHFYRNDDMNKNNNSVSSIIRSLLVDDNTLTGKQIRDNVLKTIPDANPNTIQVTYSKMRKSLGITGTSKIPSKPADKPVEMKSGYMSTWDPQDKLNVLDDVLSLYRSLRGYLESDSETFHDVLVLLHEDVGLGVDFIKRHITEK